MDLSDPPSGFSNIQVKAACIFAQRARLEAAEPFHGEDAWAAGLAAAARVADFASRMDDELLDGLVIELTDPRHGASVAAVARTTFGVLGGLLHAEGDTASAGLVEAGTEHWWLTLCGSRWFVLTFAPCYGEDSPRFGFGSSSTFVVLQPVSSFDRHATPRGATITPQVRLAIRDAYAEQGRQYNADLAQQDVESLKYVWPLRLGDSPVAWWRDGKEAT